MADGAVHLVEHVPPEVPLTQRVVRIVKDAITRWQGARSESGKAGGIIIRHRFGGSVNVHNHAHLLMLDGGYRKGAGGGL